MRRSQWFRTTPIPTVPLSNERGDAIPMLTYRLHDPTGDDLDIAPLSAIASQRVVHRGPQGDPLTRARITEIELTIRQVSMLFASRHLRYPVSAPLATRHDLVRRHTLAH